MSAWLNLSGVRKREAFILLTDDLSDSERDGLLQVTDIALDVHGDLIKRLAEVEKENKHLRSLSLTDALTGLYNYRFFYKQLEIEMARTRRTGHSCSLMMIDLDNFKLLNDTWGHVEGNNFLVGVASIVGQNVRPTDILCRYGGDEFAVIMPATGLFDAMRMGQRLRECVSGIPWKLDHAVSASIGLAEYLPDSEGEASAFIDHTAIEMLEELYDELKLRGITFKVANMYEPIRDSLRKTKLEKEIVESEVPLTIEDCIELWKTGKTDINNEKV